MKNGGAHAKRESIRDPVCSRVIILAVTRSIIAAFPAALLIYWTSLRGSYHASWLPLIQGLGIGLVAGLSTLILSIRYRIRYRVVGCVGAAIAWAIIVRVSFEYSMWSLFGHTRGDPAASLELALRDVFHGDLMANFDLALVGKTSVATVVAVIIRCREVDRVIVLSLFIFLACATFVVNLLVEGAVSPLLWVDSLLFIGLAVALGVAFHVAELPFSEEGGRDPASRLLP
ncbi:hypothetical protein OAX78_04175 [Planctomycetota bacterium]|nr:hypothetical protein [Planctomycetota bacterium]